MIQQLAGAFAERLRVLVIDQDPQGSVSKNFFGVSEIERLRPYETVAAIYSDQEYDPQRIVRPTSIENISVAPANDYLEPFDLPRGLGEQLLFRLRTFVTRVHSDYDIILIDTPPNVSNVLGWASLAASDYVATPLIPAKNSVEAVFDVKKRLQQSLATDNPDLIDLGYFLTNFDSRLKIHHVALQALTQLHGEQIFRTIVYSRKGYYEAPFALQPVTQREPKSEEAELIRQLLHEIVERINHRVHVMDGIDNEKEHEQARQANTTTG